MTSTGSGSDGGDDGEKPAPKIDLFPTSVLAPIANAQQAPQPKPNVVRVPGWQGGRDVDLGSPFDFPAPPRPEQTEEARNALLGPAYSSLAPATGMEASFDQQIQAEAALALLPGLLLGAVAKPAVAFLYKQLDAIPEAMRRPLERNFGLLIDNALSLASDAIMPLVDVSIDQLHPDGKGLPPSSSIDLQAHSQTELSCAETAVATLLKYTGDPTSLQDVDTQAEWAQGASGLVDEELRRRGLSLISGPGDLDKLKAFLAHQYPVMVSVGWADGGGHMVVVTGYDDRTKTVTIDNWGATGDVTKVSYDEFLADWGRHLDYMTAVVPQRDTRLTALEKAGDLRRPDRIYEGLTLSDFYVTQDGKVFVEGAYRYLTHDTDITVRVSFNQNEDSLARQLGGSLAIKRAITDGWYLGLAIDKVSLRSVDDNWSSFSTMPLAIYGSLKAPGFELKAGTEDGGFQASVTADLSRLISGLGMNVNYSRDKDSTWRLFATITGTL